MTETVIYNRIAALRAERGIERQILAEALGVGYKEMGHIERGDYAPSLEMALRISEFFGAPLESIFSRRPFEPTREERYGRLL